MINRGGASRVMSPNGLVARLICRFALPTTYQDGVFVRLGILKRYSIIQRLLDHISWLVSEPTNFVDSPRWTLGIHEGALTQVRNHSQKKAW